MTFLIFLSLILLLIIIGHLDYDWFASGNLTISNFLQVGNDDIDVATVHKYFMENFGADVKLKDVFDEDSQYDIGKYYLYFNWM